MKKTAGFVVLLSILFFVLIFGAIKDVKDAAAASWPENLNFPKIQSRHQWAWKSPFSYDPARFSKYDHVGFTTVIAGASGQLLVDFTQELKKINPNTRTRIYVNPNNTAEDQTYPGHFLFYPGSKLSKYAGADETAIKVVDGANFKPGYSAMFWDFTDINDAEHVKITAVNGNQLTVIRGFKGTSTNPSFSPKRSHAKNTYLSIHVSKGENNNEWYPNWALLCKTGKEKECGTSNKNYADYKVPIWIASVIKSQTDGLKIDNAFGPWIKDNNYRKENVDINNDGISDNLTVNKFWEQGLQDMYKRLRKALPNSIIHGNQANPNRFLNGKLYQNWNGVITRDWAWTMSDYLSAMTVSQNPKVVFIDSEVTPFNFQEVRFGLATTLLGDGFYGNKGAPAGDARAHDTWYDEYDNGAGSSLIADVDLNQNYLDVFKGTGSRFKPGDEIYLSEENMKVLEVQNDRLIVQRAYMSDYLKSLAEKIQKNTANSTTHQKGEKVYTIEQIRNGKGYLGKALSKQNTKCAPASVNSCIRYFTNGVAMVNPLGSPHAFSLSGTYYRINGTQDRTVNNGKRATGSVTVPAGDGLILVKNPNLSPTPTNKPSITSTPTPTIKFPPGDGNKDGRVDGLDYLIWLNHYGTTTTRGSEDGDYNTPPDGKVDGIDYVIWLGNYR